MIFDFFFSNFKHKVILFYIIIKSSHQFTYNPKISFTLYISFEILTFLMICINLKKNLRKSSGKF